MYTSLGSDSRLKKWLIIIFVVTLAICLLELILAFVQTTHIFGFILALLLFFGTCAMIWWTIMLSRKDELESKKIIVIAVTVIVELLTLLVFIMLFIKLINFMASPNLKSSADSNSISSMTENIRYTNDNAIEYFKFFKNAPIPNYTIDQEKFKKCISEGAQTRLQHYEVVLDYLKLSKSHYLIFIDAYVYVHVNESDFFLGLVKDKGMYANLLTGKKATICESRIGHVSEGQKDDDTRDCVKKLYECFTQAIS